MSFYINNQNNRKPCSIDTTALNEICEKVLIEVPRIFDACIQREENIPYTLVLTNFSPATPVYPLTYISAVNDPLKTSTIISTNIDRSDNRPNFACVTVVLEIPILVTFIDNEGIAGTAESSITVTKSAILFVPQDSLSPITITAFATFLSTIGTFTNDTTLSITGCSQVVIKVLSTVDLLVPSFGYPCIPICNDCGIGTCRGIFNQPLYPTRQNINP